MTPADGRDAVRSSGIESVTERRRRRVKNARSRQAYGPKHRKRRRGWARRIAPGEAPVCPRCQLPIGADQEWDLGHDDVNPDVERPEHRGCNRAAFQPLCDVAGVVNSPLVGSAASPNDG